MERSELISSKNYGKKLTRVLASGAVVWGAIGFASACANSEEENPETPTAVFRTIQPIEKSPTIESSTKIEANRNNYLSLISKGDYDFREVRVEIDSINREELFLRRFELPHQDGGGREAGVNIEKVNKSNGEIEEIYKDLNQFIEKELLPISNDEAALVRVFAEDEHTIWGTSQSDYANDNEDYAGIRIMRAMDGECEFVDYGVARQTGEKFISVTSPIGDLVGEDCQTR